MYVVDRSSRTVPDQVDEIIAGNKIADVELRSDVIERAGTLEYSQQADVNSNGDAVLPYPIRFPETTWYLQELILEPLHGVWREE